MLMDKITQAERQAMYDFITENAFYSHSNEENRASIEKVLQYWESAKSESLYKMFEENLILSKEIDYSMSVEELSMSMENDLFEEHDDFISQILNLSYTKHSYLRDLVSSEALAKNIYDGESFQIIFPNEKKFNVNSGCKISKVLGKIATGFNLTDYERFRIAHSRILNQKELTGNLCISIHPLDYMTMSANDCGWSSCMDWTDDNGCYRRGTVEMMNSPMVIVAYLTSETPYDVCGLKWSNKKWRELFIVNEDIITGIKAYPYYNENLEKTVCEWLRDLAVKNLNWTYLKHYAKYDHGCESRIRGLRNPTTITFTTTAMYNDFRSKEEHEGFFNPFIASDYHAHYSGVGNCVSCGEATIELSENDSESVLVCMSCESIGKCVECGSICDNDDLIELDGELFCNYCYDHSACDCEICEEVHNNETCDELYLVKEVKENNLTYVSPMRFITICCECKRKIDTGRAKDLFNVDRISSYSDGAFWDTKYYVRIEDCTEEGLRLFGFDNIKEAQKCANGLTEFIVLD